MVNDAGFDELLDVGCQIAHGATKADKAWALAFQAPGAQRGHGEAQLLAELRMIGDSVGCVARDIAVTARCPLPVPRDADAKGRLAK